MAEILQAMRTFAMLHESETNIEEGQQKEFLRGTFSIMQFDENSKEQIDELKAKFMRYRKELGGLDIEEFKAALRPLTSKGISLNQILTTFRKMDPCDEEALTWNDFMNFAIEMKPINYNNLVPRNTTESGWYIDMICMYHNGFICAATTARDLIFYDYTRAGWSRK
uniref:EF-hand domain-containing protein n=1 Tax=Biomphalaria glabrata TaxID=6526 RepID=A0A2C9KNN8_BIOGL